MSHRSISISAARFLVNIGLKTSATPGIIFSNLAAQTRSAYKAMMVHQIPTGRYDIAILGAGQLAQMMAFSGLSQGFRVHTLSAKKDDPGAQATGFWQNGNPHNSADIRKFLKGKTHLTFESEFVDTDFLIEFENKLNLTIFPRPHLMKLFQYRNSQKKTLLDFHLPTAEFRAIKNLEDFEDSYTQFQGRFVLKKTFGGYDGYGTFFVRTPRDFEKYKSFFQTAKSRSEPSLQTLFVAEKWIAFKRELALVVARSADGTHVALPLVESKQINARCDWVKGPIRHPKISNLHKKIFLMLDRIQYVGCIAFELFDTGSDLLVNEVAPRVHNSGHFSQDVLLHSQFDYHLMAGLGFSLPPVKLKAKAFAMTNLLGKSENDILVPPNLSGKLHLYSKAENRPGRKMGHVNYVGENSNTVLKLALAERKKFRL